MFGGKRPKMVYHPSQIPFYSSYFNRAVHAGNIHVPSSMRIQRQNQRGTDLNWYGNRFPYMEQPQNPFQVAQTNQPAFIPFGNTNPPSGFGGLNPNIQANGGFPPFLSQGSLYPFSGEQGNQHSPAEIILQNPLQPNEGFKKSNGHSYMGNQAPFLHPYPKLPFAHKQPTGVQSIVNSFKTQEGSFDFNKMIDTAGQMMNAVNQVSSLVKGLGGFFKA